jgi:general secretion pathway protein G
MNKHDFRKKNKGFTIIELLVIISVISILAAAFLPRLTGVIDKAKIANVREEFRNLRNSMTIIYFGNNEYPEDIEKIKKLELASENMLRGPNEEYYDYTNPDNNTQNYRFGYYFEKLDKILILENGIIYWASAFEHDFADYDDSFLAALDLSTGSWNAGEESIYTDGGEAKIFMENNNDEYTLVSNAKMTSLNSNGYGIFLDTQLESNDPNNDSGFILQFDKGFGGGEVILRPRITGSEQGPGDQRLDLDESISQYLSNNSDKTEEDYWHDEHEIKMEVRRVTAEDKEVDVYIDGLMVGTLEYESEELENAFTGFRTWGSRTDFYNLDIR